MKEYISIPTKIEAVQITDSTFDGPHPNAEHIKGVFYNAKDRYVLISTPEGRMRGEIGDWIIRGTEGELYPCKDVVFKKKYKEVGS